MTLSCKRSMLFYQNIVLVVVLVLESQAIKDSTEVFQNGKPSQTRADRTNYVEHEKRATRAELEERDERAARAERAERN